MDHNPNLQKTERQQSEELKRLIPKNIPQTGKTKLSCTVTHQIRRKSIIYVHVFIITLLRNQGTTSLSLNAKEECR